MIPIGSNVYGEGAGYDLRGRPLVKILGIIHGAVISDWKTEFQEGAYTELVDRAPAMILGRGAYHKDVFWSHRVLRGERPEGGRYTPGLYVYHYHTVKMVGDRVGLFDGWESV